MNPRVVKPPQSSGETARDSVRFVRSGPPYLSVSEREARGRIARSEVPRSSHAVFDRADPRMDPVQLLESQAASRVPELVPIRYGRMLASPFAFYRGAALIMAADLAGTPRSGLNAQLCGDAHLSNFGLFASPERELVFDLNDFDETLPGPWEWDLKRLVASVAIAGRHNGFTRKHVDATVASTVSSYRTSMVKFARMSNLDVWYDHVRAEDVLKEITGRLDPDRIASVRKTVDRAKTRDSLQAFRKLAKTVDGESRITAQPPLVTPLADLVDTHDHAALVNDVNEVLKEFRASLANDRAHLFDQFKLTDVARKVVGVGSVGTRAWILLFEGRNSADPLFLQAKEAQRSVLEDYASPSEFVNHGQRVVAGQRLVQGTSDIFLGWQQLVGLDGKKRDFYVRQLRDWKMSIDPEALQPQGMTLYGGLCGRTLARAHARTGDRIAIASYLGKSDSFDRALVEFANAYADQNELDYNAFKAAVDSGQLEAVTGV